MPKTFGTPCISVFSRFLALFFLVDFSHCFSKFLKAAPRQSKCSSKKRRSAVITSTPEKKALEKLNSIRRTKVRTQKKAKKRICCHHHQLRKSGCKERHSSGERSYSKKTGRDFN